MNMLIIGNGLDLDLKLPTKYSNFLNFTNAFKIFVSPNADEIDEFNISETCSVIFNRYNIFVSASLKDNYQKAKSALKKFDKCFSDKFINKACKDFHNCTYGNCWINYFNERYNAHLIAGENWIDIESEIQTVINIFEDERSFEVVFDKEDKKINSAFVLLHDTVDIQKITDELKKNTVVVYLEDYLKLKKRLLDDFDKFIMALGIYLDFFVGKLSPDLKSASKELRRMMTADSIKIDCVLSFNYKNNFNKISASEVYFVHGSINYVQELQKHISAEMSKYDKDYMRIEEIISRNKMIVGFDDLQDGEENFTAQNTKLEFIDYRKYFQRIYKGTDSQYFDRLNEYQVDIKKSIQTIANPEDWDNLYRRKCSAEIISRIPNHVFIFGHSLDATDNEIFKDIFLRELDDTQITIYYHDSDARKRIITNLNRILSKQILIQKTKGNNATIKFVKQTY